MPTVPTGVMMMVTVPTVVTVRTTVLRAVTVVTTVINVVTTTTAFVLYTNPLFLSWLIPALLLLMLLLWFICHLCCKKTVKEPPPTQERAKEPEETCPMQTCPTVIVPCGCQGGRMERMEGRCINVALMKPHCGQVPCGPKICVQPSRECFPIKNFCSRCQHPLSMCPRLPSRMLPLIHPPAPSYPIVLRK
ncbi:hypothetical protein Cadr_000008994 [Camelus dromedarius]|uniref:Uncharacterized protein n=1 Tax=Camelus dromedarius TaxID=9838 RepID=A0A5N4DIC5_CAMDR|nr:hypothetical protein Cadr_000008994 [Camelus dromedarius]